MQVQEGESLKSAHWIELLVSVLLLLAPMARAAGADEPSRDARIAGGEVLVTQIAIEGVSIPELLIEGVFDAPPEKVWALVDACGGYREIMPMVSESRETERVGEESQCSWTVQMPFPLANIKTLVAATSVARDGKWRREYKQVSGGFLRNQGSWELFAFGDDGKRTRFAYRYLAVIDTIFPDTFVKSGQLKAARQMVATIRERLARH